MNTPELDATLVPQPALHAGRWSWRKRGLVVLVVVGACLGGIVVLTGMVARSRSTAAMAMKEAAGAPGLALQMSESKEMEKTMVFQDQGQGRAPGAPVLRAPAMVFPEPAPGRKLVYTGHLKVHVKHYTEAFDRVQTIAEESGGYLAAMEARRPDPDQARGVLELRVPPTQYFQTLNKLRTLGQVAEETSHVQDITRRCAALEARIAHRRELETRMWDAMRARNANVENLEYTGETLGRAEDALDQLETERYQLQQDMAYARIQVALQEPGAVLAERPERPGFWSPVTAALQKGVADGVKALSQVLYLALVLAPWAMLVWTAWFLGRRGLRRLKEARGSAGSDNVAIGSAH